MYSGNGISSDDTDETVVVSREDPDFELHAPKIGPYVQVDCVRDDDGEFVVKSFKRNESEFGSTVNHPTFKTPDVPRKAFKVSDRYQLVEPKPPTVYLILKNRV